MVAVYYPRRRLSSPDTARGFQARTSELGTTYVVAPGPEFEVLSTNELDDICMATPAASAGTLYFRTRSSVIAIAE